MPIKDKQPKIAPGRKIQMTPLQQFQASPFDQRAVDELKFAMETRRVKMPKDQQPREKRAWELREKQGSNFFLNPSRFLGGVVGGPPPKKLGESELRVEQAEEFKLEERRMKAKMDAVEERMTALSPPATPDKLVRNKSRRFSGNSPGTASTAAPETPSAASPPDSPAKGKTAASGGVAQGGAAAGAEAERTVQQKSNNRYLDAYAEGEEGSGAMTRENDQGGDGTQKWIFSPEDDKGHFTIRQVSSGKCLDANGEDEDGGVKVSGYKGSFEPGCHTQRWRVEAVGPGAYRISQPSNKRILDAYSDPAWAGGKDWQVVTRPPQDDDTQLWLITPPLSL